MTARQSKTDKARKPSMAPTAMKTVPSGKFVFCMNGAPLVSGTIRGGGRTPESVGSGGAVPVLEAELGGFVVEVPDVAVDDAAVVPEV